MNARLTRRRLMALMAMAGATRGTAQGFAGMAADAEGFTLPVPGYRFRFPQDHGAHPGYRIEWWYLTTNLTTASGAACGLQWTLFRSALAPGTAPGWQSPQIWFAHAAMTRAGQHVATQTFARGGIGQAGVTPAPFAAWINDWNMTGADDLSVLDLNARGPDWRYRLSLTADGPLVFHGDGGYSVKHERGQASYYYSQPHYEATGTLDWPDGSETVTGTAWLDREWSSQPLDADQTGWDWFSLHLETGAKVMLFRLRETGRDGFHSGTWIAPDGTAMPIPGDAIRLEPLETAEVAGRTLPVRWRVRVAGHGLDATVTALTRDCWMGVSVPYWEGPVRVSGSTGGTGYLEMTGYDG